MATTVAPDAAPEGTPLNAMVQQISPRTNSEARASLKVVLPPRSAPLSQNSIAQTSYYIDLPAGTITYGSQLRVESFEEADCQSEPDFEKSPLFSELVLTLPT